LCEPTDPAAWHAIGAFAADTSYEVPFWIWANVHKQVFSLLEKYKDDDTQDLFFRWGNIARYLELARVCLTGQYAEISLPLAAVEENSAYSKARHRLFMSASIKDGSSLVADLGCAPGALQNIIDPAEDEGAGERMILPTSLIAAGARKEEVAEVCATLAKNTNVVVLTSSSGQASEWIKAGASLSEGKDVDKAIETLRGSSHNFSVFAQRFDGVDLPDDACRLLVIDGVPSGDRICDRVDAARQKDSPEYDIRTVNRFEQALGRAVRSNADYAAVLLVGADIAAFIGKKSVRDIFEGRTRVQVDLGRELAKLEPGQALKDVLHGLVHALLTRNEEWKEAHRTRVKAAPRTTRAVGELTIYERVAVEQRNAWLAAKSRNFQGAVSCLREATNFPDLHSVQKAELLYRIATYLHQFDPAGAAAAYRAAFELNSDFPRPDQVVDKRFARISEQAAEVASYFGKFISANAALARLDEIKAKLSFGMVADVVEQGLYELGKALGATSSRPEKETGRGPDVMWLFDDVAMCIEAKSEKTAPIHKSDAAQLVLSHQWCEQHVAMDKAKILPVFATNTTTAERAEDIAFGPRLMDEVTVFGMVDALRQLVLGLSFDGPLFGDPANVGKALSTRGLLGKQIPNGLKAMKV
jgi:tetratricopeptide (TPR) repeat protein